MACIILACCSNAFAQGETTGFQVAPNALRPADPHSLIVRAPTIMPVGDVSVGAAAVWTLNPLFTTWTDAPEERVDVIAGRLRSRVGVQATPLRGIEAGASVDVAHLQTGELGTSGGLSQRVGDITVRGKWRLPIKGLDSHFGAAVFGEFGIPTGSKSAYLSDGRPTGEFGLALATRFGMLEPRVDVSWRIRRSQRFVDRRIDDMFRWGVALPIQLDTRLEAGAYIRGNHVVSSDTGRAINPIQTGAQVRLDGERLTVFASAGTGAVRDVGAPSFEVASGLTFSFDVSQRVGPAKLADQKTATAEHGTPSSSPRQTQASPSKAPPVRRTPVASAAMQSSDAPPIASTASADRTSALASPPESALALIDTAVVYFATNSAALSTADISTLVRLARTLRNHPSILRVRIEGHADDRGTAESNILLSLRRARAVKGFLEGQGVAGSRLDVVGYGDSRPAHGARIGDEFAFDRRVEFQVETLDDSE